MLEDLCRRVGRRGATLLLLSVVDITLGYSMLTVAPEVIHRAYLGQQLIAPLKLWAYAWFGVAVVLAVTAFRAWDRIGFGFAMGMKLLWALGFWISFFNFHMHRSIIWGCLWVVITGWLYLVAGWPEPVKDRHVPE